MVRLGDEAQVEGQFSPFGYSGYLEQDSYTVCTKCTRGSNIILDAPDGTTR
jgi:hypothetical protein